jgi:transcription elongation GreA/GreB family factor
MRDPATLLLLVRASVEASLVAARREAAATRGGTQTDGEERAANRGERGAVAEQGYLSSAMAGRIAELEGAMRRLDLLAPGPRTAGGPGALLTLEDEDGATIVVLIAPGAPGGPLPGAADVLGVSPASPLGAALAGARVGDEVIAVRGGREVALVVTSVA